jgi:hypothetical protein
LRDSVRLAEVEILKYLLAHKDARDTAEGIEKWWLPQSQQYGRTDIDEALRELEKLDLVRVWQPASALPIFGQGSAPRGALETRLRALE